VQNAIDLAPARHLDAESRDPSGRENRDHETQIDARRRGTVQDGRPGTDLGGVINGPLAFDIEAGNMLAKQLEYLAKAEIAGIVLGARVPIILTSRAARRWPGKAPARSPCCWPAARLRPYHDPATSWPSRKPRLRFRDPNERGADDRAP